MRKKSPATTARPIQQHLREADVGKRRRGRGRHEPVDAQQVEAELHEQDPGASGFPSVDSRNDDPLQRRSQTGARAPSSGICAGPDDDAAGGAPSASGHVGIEARLLPASTSPLRSRATEMTDTPVAWRSGSPGSDRAARPRPPRATRPAPTPRRARRRPCRSARRADRPGRPDRRTAPTTAPGRRAALAPRRRPRRPDTPAPAPGRPQRPGTSSTASDSAARGPLAACWRSASTRSASARDAAVRSCSAAVAASVRVRSASTASWLRSM